MVRSYYGKKILRGISFIFLIIIINFTIMHLAPGNPIEYVVGNPTFGAPPLGYVEEITKLYGWDQPIYIQLIKYINLMFHGDFGYSYFYHKPALDVISGALFNTLILTSISFIIALVLGVSLGMVSAIRAHSKLDNILTTISVMLWSIPLYWMGLLFIIVFSFGLNWFPSGGIFEPGLQGWDRFISELQHAALPIITLSLAQFGGYYRLARASMLEQLHSDYVFTAWAKGADSKTVYFKHVLRNAIIPIVTVALLRLSGILHGVVTLEAIFGWPGLGSILFQAISSRDFQLIMSSFVIFGVLTVTLNIIADIFYSILDPRIRLA